MCIYRWISTYMRKLIQYLIEWGKDYNEVVSELKDNGIIITNYQGHSICTYINRYDDKLRSIQPDNRNSKGSR